MSLEENKAIIRRVVEEMWNNENLEVIDELWAPNFVKHTSSGEIQEGIDGLRQRMQERNANWRTTFPDHHATIEDMIAEGDKVVIRCTWRATHSGNFMGIPPTGKRVTGRLVHIYRIAGGKIEELWAMLDRLGMLEQLGLAPPLEQAGE